MRLTRSVADSSDSEEMTIGRFPLLVDDMFAGPVAGAASGQILMCADLERRSAQSGCASLRQLSLPTVAYAGEDLCVVRPFESF